MDREPPTTGQQHSSSTIIRKLAAVGPTYAVPERQHTSSSVSGRVTGHLRSTPSLAACPSLAWPSRLPVHFDNLLSAGRSRTRCRTSSRTSRLQRRRGTAIVTSPLPSRQQAVVWQVAGHESHPPCPRQGPGAGCRGPNTDWAWAAPRGCVGRVPSPVPRTFRTCLYLFTKYCERATLLRLKKGYMEICTAFFAGDPSPLSPSPEMLLSAQVPSPSPSPTNHRPHTYQQPANRNTLGMDFLPLLPLSRPPTSSPGPPVVHVLAPGQAGRGNGPREIHSHVHTRTVPSTTCSTVAVCTLMNLVDRTTNPGGWRQAWAMSRCPIAPELSSAQGQGERVGSTWHRHLQVLYYPDLPHRVLPPLPIYPFSASQQCHHHDQAVPVGFRSIRSLSPLTSRHPLWRN